MNRPIWVGLYLDGRIHSGACFYIQNLRVWNKGQWNSRRPVSSHYVPVSLQTSLASRPSWQYRALRVALPQSSVWQTCPTVLFTVIFLSGIWMPMDAGVGKITPKSWGRDWLKLSEGVVPHGHPWHETSPSIKLWGGGNWQGVIWKIHASV
jgi:hypothetical protein